MKHPNTNKLPHKGPPAAKILIVDDDAGILDVFPQMLSDRYAITVASRGSLALDLAANDTFDLAFVDYFMDDMNGVIVAQRLRQLQPHIQIVLMSGYTFEDKSEIMASSGARAFLHKPLDAEYLQALTERLLGDKASGEATPQ